MSEKEGKTAQTRIYNNIEKTFGFKQRVFAVQVLRPWYGFDVEKRYREASSDLSNEWKRARKSGDKDATRDVEKQQKKFREDFFASEKEKNPEMFTLQDMYFSFDNFSRLTAMIFNKACSVIFQKIICNEKPSNTENLIKELLDTRFVLKKKEYNVWEMFGDGYSDYISGLSRNHVESLFKGGKVKDYIIGKASIPNASVNFPITFYRSATKKHIVEFFGVDYENERLVNDEPGREFDDYVVILRVPVLRPTEKRKKKAGEDGAGGDDTSFLDVFDRVSFVDMPFIIRSNHLLKTARDGSSNAMIKDYLDGTVDNKIRQYISDHEEKISEFIKSKEFTKKNKKTGMNEIADISSVVEEGIHKWTGISSYEIVKRDTKRQRGAYFFHFTCQVLPKNVTAKSEDRVMGIDFCFSKKKILQCTIIDLDEKRKNPGSVRKWIVDEMPILESVYHLHSMYAKFYTSMKNLQRSGRKDIRNRKSIPFVQRAFENKRRYFIGKIVSEIVKRCIDRNVSIVRVENLSGLRGKDDWFTVHRIRSFPVLGMLDKIESKLEENGITMERVNPKNTSRTCPACGIINDDFTFEYRKTHGFPAFTCANKECSESSEPTNGMEYHFRDADLNASINIALRDASVDVENTTSMRSTVKSFLMKRMTTL